MRQVCVHVSDFQWKKWQFQMSRQKKVYPVIRLFALALGCFVFWFWFAGFFFFVSLSWIPGSLLLALRIKTGSKDDH